MGVILAKLLGRLPLSVLYTLVAPMLYFLIFRVFRYRVKVAKHNIKHALGHYTQEEQGKLLRDYYRYLSELIVEVLHGRYMTPEEFSERCIIKNQEAIEASWAAGRHVIIMALHQGNWEWMLSAMSSTSKLPLEVIYKPLHNKAFDKYFYETRAQFGTVMVPHKRAVKAFSNRKSPFFLGVLSDQAPQLKRTKIWSKMLGVDTSFPVGAESFAASTDADIFYATVTRTSRGHYEAEFNKMCEAPYPSGENKVTHAYAQRATESITEQPFTWLWSNRRWRYTKADDQTLRK